MPLGAVGEADWGWNASLTLFCIAKKGKLNASHRYNLLLLLPSDPGRIQRELVVHDLPRTKVRK